MEAAVVLNGNQVQKIIKNKKFYKIVRNPNIKILEECSKELLDEKYDYWNRLLTRNPEEEKIEESKLFYYKNPKTKRTLVSIYSDLEKCKHYIKDWMDYERVENTIN